MLSKLGTPDYLHYVPQVPVHAEHHHYHLGGNTFFQQPSVRKRKKEPGQLKRDKAL